MYSATRRIVAITIVTLACSPVVAQISGAHSSLLVTAETIDDSWGAGTFNLPRVYFGPDDWLSSRISDPDRTHSYFIYSKVGLWNRNEGWRDINNSEASFYFGCPGASCSWSTQTCSISPDEVWVTTYDPAHLTTPLVQLTEGWNVPSWHSMRRISPCTQDPDGLNSYSHSQPFTDEPFDDRLFMILDVSDTILFPRYVIQFVDDKGENARWFSPQGWVSLFELDSALWQDAGGQPEIQLLHVACPDKAVQGGEAGSVRWDCLFNFNWRRPDGTDPIGFSRPSVGHMRIEFKESNISTDPYKVWIKNPQQQLILLPKVNGLRTLTFKPFEDPQFFDGWRGRGFIVQQILTRTDGTKELWMTLIKAVAGNPSLCNTGSAYANNGGGQDVTVYHASYNPGTFLVTGPRVALSKSTSSAPPGSSNLPAMPDAWTERYTVSIAGASIFSASKHDPHRNGEPYLCSRFVLSGFEGLSTVREPLNGLR